MDLNILNQSWVNKFLVSWTTTSNHVGKQAWRSSPHQYWEGQKQLLGQLGTELMRQCQDWGH